MVTRLATAIFGEGRRRAGFRERMRESCTTIHLVRRLPFFLVRLPCSRSCFSAARPPPPKRSTRRRRRRRRADALAPAGEPGQPLGVSGIVVGADDKPIPGASLYVFQTDHEGYYGVKPASDNRNPRLKLFLRSDASGAWSFETIRPGSYPSSRVPGHIHFEVTAPGRAPLIFEIVFEGDPFITDEMRRNAAFSVRPIEGGKVVQKIILK